MDVLPLGPLRVASVVWQPRRGAWAFTAVCKATYTLAPVESPLAAEQEYPNEDDNHWNDDPARSLYSPSDLVPFKPRADVTLVGHAFAPLQSPVRSLVARLIVGEVNKAIEVFGERAWTQDGALREGPRFVKMPLRYERAAGGAETSNPVGVRLDLRPDAFGNVQVPNLQPPGMMLSSRGDYIEPIGFGPLAPSWPQRRDKLGRNPGAFATSGWTEHPVPEDIDLGYFNAAPRDQQTESLRANERLILENLHPEHPRLVTSLPGVSPRAFVERRGVAPQEVTMTCDTLWIDTDRGICTLTWRGQVALEHPGAPGRVLIATAEPGQRLGWADVERLARGLDEGTATDAAPPRAAPRRGDRRGDPLVNTTGFAEVAPSLKPARPLLDLHHGEGDEVTNVGVVQGGAALPFGGLPEVKMPAPPAPPVAPAPLPSATGPAIPAAPGGREIVELLWFDPQALPRIREHAAWRRILAELGAPSDDAARRDVVGLLTRAEPSGAGGIDAAIDAAVGGDGLFTPPLLLLAGELAFPFDALEVLRATVTAVAPLVAGDRKLQEIVDAVQALAKAPLVAGGVAQGLTATVREAFAQGDRLLPQAYLDAQIERVLLEQRHYQRRTVFGEACIRSLFQPLGAAVHVPAYLPELRGMQLPMFQRLPARLLAEVHFSQDEHEPHPTALRVVALGRVVSLAARRG